MEMDLDCCKIGRKGDYVSGMCKVLCSNWWVCLPVSNEVCRIIVREPMDLEESDCLIKTKQRDCYPRVSTLCDFCPVL